MVRGRRDQARARRGRAQEGHEVDGLLEARDVREALVERDDEQEREQHLDAGQRHAQLTEQLLEVAIEPFLLGLVTSRVLSVRCAHAEERSPPAGRRRAGSRCYLELDLDEPDLEREELAREDRLDEPDLARLDEPERDALARDEPERVALARDEPERLDEPDRERLDAEPDRALLARGRAARA